jgi:hypothetical protein
MFGAYAGSGVGAPVASDRGDRRIEGARTRWYAADGRPWWDGRVRRAFAHDAVLSMAADADVRAPGAAVTVALCGHWEHEPPCPLAPHHSRAERIGDEVRVRILFATEAGRERTVRQRIDAALSAGHLRRPEGAVSRWAVRGSGPAPVSAEEAEHAARLIWS